MEDKRPIKYFTMKILVVMVMAATVTLASPRGAGKLWGYQRNTNGPLTWPAAFPKCGGSRQSPVALISDEAVPGPPVEHFTFHNYNLVPLSIKVTNTGHSVKVTPISDASLTGGNLTDRYIFTQFHFHWGSTNNRGSEHTVDGVTFPGELHLVHYRERHGSLGEALRHSRGVAVLGVPLELSLQDNLNLQPIIDGLAQISKPQKTAMISPVILRDMLPDNVDDFFRYEGSLTTPPCSEVVVWTVFKDAISISNTQLQEFRQLVASDGTPLQDNFRTLQPLNGRRVVRSCL
uniref:Carbonic anhydrase n=1 Tax=Scylla olivacea TaxID=85551 RepID=A0A0P4WBY1_SCYOL